jgi:hypothetical protein
MATSRCEDALRAAAQQPRPAESWLGLKKSVTQERHRPKTIVTSRPNVQTPGVPCSPGRPQKKQKTMVCPHGKATATNLRETTRRIKMIRRRRALFATAISALGVMSAIVKQREKIMRNCTIESK